MNSNFQFNLIGESWIPVVYLDGCEKVISIRQVFADASSIRSLADTLPTSRIATFRVLLAILYRAWEADQPRSEESALDLWEELWERQQQGTLFGESNGNLVSEELQQYLATWRHRFNLNDETAPFMQTKGMRTAKNETKPLDILVPDGTSESLFSMRIDARQLPADEAARLLVHCMAYDYSGIKSGIVGDPNVSKGKSYPMGTGVCGNYGTTLIEGRNLGETLLLNFVPLGGLPGIINDHNPGLPCWELPPPKPGQYSSDDLVLGQVSLLTWPQRRIELYWEGDHVTSVLVTNGDPAEPPALFGKETMTSWRWSEPQSKKFKRLVYWPLQISRGKELWRSGDILFPQGSRAQVDTKKFGGLQDQFKPSATSEWVIRLVSEEILDASRTFRISQTSMHYGTQNASFDDLVTDTIGLPGIYLSAEGGQMHRHLYDKALAHTSTVETELRKFANNVHVASTGDTAEIEQLDVISSRFYHQVDPHFRKWLRELPDEPTPQKVAEWVQVAKAEAIRITTSLMQEAPPQAWTVPRPNPYSGTPVDIARAEAWFHSALRKIEPENATQKETP